jgi:arylsulfatase A-like enzyme
VTRSIDVFPTLAGLAGLPADARVVGSNLSAALRGEEARPDLVAYSHTTVLARSVFEQMHSPQYRDQWNLARHLFPDDSVE